MTIQPFSKKQRKASRFYNAVVRKRYRSQDIQRDFKENRSAWTKSPMKVRGGRR